MEDSIMFMTDLVDANGCPIPLFVESVTFIKNVYPNPVKDVLKISLIDNLNVKDIYFIDLARVYFRRKK